MQKAINFNHVTIVSAKENSCRIHFWYMNKDKAINRMNNADLKEGKKIFLRYEKLIFFFLIIKMSSDSTVPITKETGKDCKNKHEIVVIKR